jgi:NAD(P)-dependent dehydrogenase (short-subunit alcohol dehydrogenase family)
VAGVTYDFTGKVALVTGAGSGIGRASAAAFATAGATVAVADLSEQGGLETVSQIEAAGGTAKFYRADVSSETEVPELIDAIVADFGGLDYAHNNAGIESPHLDLVDVPFDAWKRVLNVDLNAVFLCLKSEIPAMLQRGGGAIVNTASVSGLIGGYKLTAYTAAKHGVVGLTKAAAMEYTRKGIRINAICPGPVDTAFTADLPTEIRDILGGSTPIGRMATPQEIANSVLWLMSDDASYVLGQPLLVDGGVSLGGMATGFDS